jgi:hypothetical protein
MTERSKKDQRGSADPLESPMSCSKNTTGRMKPLQKVIAAGEFRDWLVDHIETSWDEMDQGVCTLLDNVAGEDRHNTVFLFRTHAREINAPVCIQVTVLDWQPLTKFSVQSLRTNIKRINHASCTIDLAQAISQGRELTADLVLELADPFNWVCSIPDSATITVEWWAIVKEAA